MIRVAAPTRSELIRHLAGLADAGRRAAAIAEISALLQIDTFIIFVPDPDLGKLLAAPGFPQTIPERQGWADFLASAKARGNSRAMLTWPNPGHLVPAVGLRVGDSAVLALLGGEPEMEQVHEFAELVQLVLSALMLESTAASAAVQLSLAREATRESSSLAASLDEARHAAQAEIAARKRVEAELRRARDELASANAQLEDRVRERTEELRETISELEAFSYTVSHDLRAPLRAIYGYADALAEDLADRLSAEEREQLARIARAAHRLDTMIREVLRCSRIARTEVVLHPLDLGHVIREVLAQNAALQHVSDHIEVVTPLLPVIGNEALLTQSVSNLLLNAIKFVAPGVTPRVRVRTEPREKIVRIWIEDNGIGIAREDVGRLFGMFERVHPESKFEGIGVGLAIVKRAAIRMNGAVGIEIEPGGGSRFWIDLPPG